MSIFAIPIDLEDVFITKILYSMIKYCEKKYSRDLTDKRWAIIAPFIVGMRVYKYDVRLSKFWDKISSNIIDSQSVKRIYAFEQVGFDGGKKVKLVT